jgi:hypothetical protein
MTNPNTSNETRDPLAVVCWPGQGGVTVQSYPLPRPLAEEVARAYAAIYPRVSFWLEDIAWLPSGVSEGRPAHRTHRPSQPVGAAHV